MSRRPALSAGLLALLSLWGAGCGSDEPRSAPRYEIQIRAPQAPPPRYRAVLGSGGREVWRVTCPQAESMGPLRCSAEGLSVERVPADTVLTIKAPGYSFVTRSMSEEERLAGRLALDLVPLAPFEVTEAYRSGIGIGEGEGAFLDLAATTETELGPAQSVKFYIGDFPEPKVYFQNTRLYPLHYDFVRQGLGLPLSRPQFEQRTYYGEARKAMAGTLVYYPALRFPSDVQGAELARPIGLEFFPSDDLTPSQALLAHRLIEERLLWLGLEGAEKRLVYMPAGSIQEQALVAAKSQFAQADALFAGRVEVYAGVDQQILNRGIAYGTLRLFTPAELLRAAVSFRDIALLTRLPNDLPLVGGTITEELQTPLAHVNLAARARGTPNIALRAASTDVRIAPLLNQLVRFEVKPHAFSLDRATLDEARAFWDSQTRAPLVPKSDDSFQEMKSFGEMTFADSIRFGAKAANLAELKKVLGDLAPSGFGVPFAVYHQYMSRSPVTDTLCNEARADCEREGRAVDPCDRARAHCAAAAAAGVSYGAYVERLLGDDGFLSDTPLREACLDGLVYLVGHGSVDAELGATLDARVTEVFGPSKVRLRSSTNAEDLPGFSGAGLYESLSAYGSGPERASARIREVWASVWTFRAFEERQFWNIDHRALRMALAVNVAVDDEVVNGVLITQNLANPASPGFYVNVQAGEVEVTNPPSGAIAEVFSIIAAPKQGFQVVRQRFSSLSPGRPLLDDAEIAHLATAASQVEQHFASLYPERPPLDLEFKFHGPERRLLIKQARPYSSAMP
jgi:pyruvate, water dikinase